MHSAAVANREAKSNVMNMLCEDDSLTLTERRKLYIPASIWPAEVVVELMKGRFVCHTGRICLILPKVTQEPKAIALT